MQPRSRFALLLPPLLAVVALAACVDTGSPPRVRATGQAVAGPSVTTVSPPTVGGVPVAGQLVVSWSADPAAVKYYVLQSAGGGAFVDVASVLDPAGGAPPTTWTATALAGGGYCYALQTAYGDGTMSDPGTAVCGTAMNGSTGGGSAELDIPGQAWTIAGATAGFPLLSDDGVWSFDPAASNTIVASPHTPSPITVTSLRVRVARNNTIHPSVGTIVALMRQRSDGTATVLAEADIGPSFGTGWVTVEMIPASAPLTVERGRAIWLSLSTSGFLGFGDPPPQFDTAVMLYSM